MLVQAGRESCGVHRADARTPRCPLLALPHRCVGLSSEDISGSGIFVWRRTLQAEIHERHRRPDNDAKHGDATGACSFCDNQTSPTRLWYLVRTLVLISEADSCGGAYRTEGNGRHSSATRQPSRRAMLVPRARRRHWFCSQSRRQVPLVFLRGNPEDVRLPPR